MIILPAIDLLGGKAVRLMKGDYDKKTVYSDSPSDVALSFLNSGAKYIHIVDLDGAKSGNTDNFDTVSKIVEKSGLFAEVGGGIRSIDTVASYLEAGVSRVIIGTAAVKDPVFLETCLDKYGDKIAVGIDIKDGYVAVHGWTEVSDLECDVFFERMQTLGVKNIICTDISKDGMMQGTNLELYKHLSGKFNVDITASGGISSIEDIRQLSEMDIYGAILGKSLYTGAIDLADAIKECKK